MSESTTGLLVLTGISVLAALLVHALCHRYRAACLGAAVLTSLTFNAAATLHSGHLDAFILISLATCAIVGLVTAVLVGLPFVRIRRKREDL